MRPLLVLLASAPVWGNLPVPLSKGFQHFYNLEYDHAIAEFSKEIAKRPADPAGYNHMAQAVIYKEMYRAGSLESELVTGSNPFLRRARITPAPEDQKRFDDAIQKAEELSRAILASHPDDKEGLYALGVAYGLRANYSFLVKKAWRQALREFTESRKLHNRMASLYPEEIDAQLVQGLHDYVVGSLPFGWKLLGFLAGFHGDRDGGLARIERVAKAGVRCRVDAMVLLAAAYRRERHAEKAVPLLRQLIAYFPRNYLFRLELVQMFADLGKKDEALDVLDRMDRSAPAAKVQFSRGNLLFWYRDFAGAIENLAKSCNASLEAGVNTVAQSCLRLGQSYDMTGRRAEALAAYRRAIEQAPDSDGAQEAERYLSRPYRRSD